MKNTKKTKDLEALNYLAQSKNDTEETVSYILANFEISKGLFDFLVDSLDIVDLNKVKSENKGKKADVFKFQFDSNMLILSLVKNDKKIENQIFY